MTTTVRRAADIGTLQPNGIPAAGLAKEYPNPFAEALANALGSLTPTMLARRIGRRPSAVFGWLAEGYLPDESVVKAIEKALELEIYTRMSEHPLYPHNVRAFPVRPQDTACLKRAA